MNYYKTIIYIGIIILIFISISISHSLYLGYKYDNYKKKLLHDIEMINKDNESMREQLKYLSSSNYKEKKAKELLNLKNRDETLIIITHNNKKNNNHYNENLIEYTSIDVKPNYLYWIEYFTK